jgi:hypothetical protein
MREGIEGTGGLLITGFFDPVFLCFQNYQRHIRTYRGRHILLEIQRNPIVQTVNYVGGCRGRRLRCILDFKTIIYVIFNK